MKLVKLTTFVTIALAAIVSAKKHHHHPGHAKHTTRDRNDPGHHIGVPWGCDPSCISGLKSTHRTSLNWYHHWQDTGVSELDKLGFEYVPTFWGPSKWDKWNSVKSGLSGKEKYMLAFNEPDVQGQSDMGPKAAAKLWMKELKPFADRGVQVGSPQICWNMQWLEKFMQECNRLGCNISFIALHWYGSWRDFDKFTNWIESVRNAFGLDIWITEYGITQASAGTQQQIKDFHIKALKWMKQQGYVKRSAWLGGFPVNEKPDPYPSNLNSYFNGDGSARDLLKWISQHGGGNYLSLSLQKRDDDSSAAQKDTPETKSQNNADEEIKHNTVEQYDEDHCDYRCQLRQSSLEKHHRKRKGVVEVKEGEVCVKAPSKLDREERTKLTSCLRDSGLLKKQEHKQQSATSNEIKLGEAKHRHIGTPKQQVGSVENA